MKKRTIKKILMKTEAPIFPLQRTGETKIFVPEPTVDTTSMSDKEKIKLYRNGGQGFIQWCEDNVCLAIYNEGSDVPKWTAMNALPSEKHPLTGRSYKDCWDLQKPILLEALQMFKGRFLYRLIVLCWMRGDGKSLIACLIQLWKFFCFPKQTIMLGANSKDQVKFVHYDIMREIINNSPKLLAVVGAKNIQEKEIRLRDSRGVTVSIIRSISSFSGIVSNITGYTFSEIFDMKNPKFFVQLDGSTRNMPNALGVIDSTVSSKTHILYKLHLNDLEARKTGKKSLTFFSYRCSKMASYMDFFNPQMTQEQIDDYKFKFPPLEFDRYFRNVWESGIGKVFSENDVKAMRILSVHPTGKPYPNNNSIHKHLERLDAMLDGSMPSESENSKDAVKYLAKMEVPMSTVYTLDKSRYFDEMATEAELRALSDIYDTDWAVGVGVDRADPLKVLTHGARTIVTIVAKGLPGSRSDTTKQYQADAVNAYIYVVLGVIHVKDNTLEGIKNTIVTANERFDGVDMLCAERWGMFDIVQWMQEQNIKCELITPSPDRQKMAFTEFYQAVSSERFKCPPVGVAGHKMDDIITEEALTFEQAPDKVWYGSPEKEERYGAQDDSMYSLAWNIYGMREINSALFRERGITPFMGMYIPEKNLYGNYGG